MYDIDLHQLQGSGDVRVGYAQGAGSSNNYPLDRLLYRQIFL
jgi:hypothetical protein